MLALLVLLRSLRILRAVHELMIDTVVKLRVVVDFVLPVLVTASGFKLEDFFFILHHRR